MFVGSGLLHTASASAVAGLLLVSTGGLAQGINGPHQGAVSLRSTAATHVMPPNLGRLNAAHAVLTGHTQGAPEATVSQLYAYQQAKGNALVLPAETPAQKQARAAALGRADALLELVANKPVTAQTIAQVDMMLGIAAAPRASN
jgi:hypothetical protein